MKKLLIILFAFLAACGQPSKEETEAPKQTPEETQAWLDSILDAAMEENESEPRCMWTLNYFADEFGERTTNKYITTRLFIKGTFSNSATENSDLNVNFIITDATGISIQLYEYARSNPVKGGYRDHYKIRVKPADGERVELTATNTGNRLSLTEKGSQILSDLLAQGGKVIFSIIETEGYSQSSYRFTIEDASCYDVTLAEMNE